MHTTLFFFCISAFTVFSKDPAVSLGLEAVFILYISELFL